MDINLTLIIQMAVFAAFVLFTMKFVWPPLSKAMEERQNKIADGLAAAERGHKELELAQYRAKDEIRVAKTQATEILDKATRQAASLIEEARQMAKVEAQKQFKLAQEQLDQEKNRAEAVVRQSAATLAIAGAERILRRELDDRANAALLDDFIRES